MSDHQIFIGTDGDREYLVTKWDAGDLDMAVRAHLGETWGPPEPVTALKTRDEEPSAPVLAEVPC